VRATLLRVASNEARFAAANDAIAVQAAVLDPVAFVPFLCECPNPQCTQIAELTLGEYAVLRLVADHFLVSCRCRGGDVAGSEVVHRTARFTVVERPAA
jgi:hypothetical protein